MVNFNATSEKMAYFMDLFRHLKDIVLVDGESDFSDTD